MSTIAEAGLEETDARHGPTASQSYFLSLLTLSKHLTNCAPDRRSLYIRKENLRAKGRRVRRKSQRSDDFLQENVVQGRGRGKNRHLSRDYTSQLTQLVIIIPPATLLLYQVDFVDSYKNQSLLYVWVLQDLSKSLVGYSNLGRRENMGINARLNLVEQVFRHGFAVQDAHITARLHLLNGLFLIFFQREQWHDHEGHGIIFQSQDRMKHHAFSIACLGYKNDISFFSEQCLNS